MTPLDLAIPRNVTILHFMLSGREQQQARRSRADFKSSVDAMVAAMMSEEDTRYDIAIKRREAERSIYREHAMAMLEQRLGRKLVKAPAVTKTNVPGIQRAHEARKAHRRLPAYLRASTAPGSVETFIQRRE